LGGAVVTAAGASVPVASVVDVDQSLRLGAFKAQLVAAEPMLRDADQYQLVVDAMFEMMSGPLLPWSEVERISALRRAEHEVVLGVWELLLSQSVDEIDATVDRALGGYSAAPVSYLALFGLDPGDDYGDWIGERVPGSIVEYWPDHGHYPHLVDPDRFVARLLEFWA
jgi:pimeloyl-ACP methyl ester carboxylesterase